MNAFTMTGYPVEAIPELIDAIYPADAYEPIPYGNMAGKTDLGQEWVRGRLDQVFGAQGYGWRLMPYGAIGGTFTSEELRKNKKGEDVKWYVVRLESWVLEYCLKIDDKREWVTTSVISGSDDNTELPYAYKGAFTNLMKHAVRAMGGIAHIYAGYGHEQAKRGNHPDAWYPGTAPKIRTMQPASVEPQPALDPQKEAIKAWYREAQQAYPELNAEQFLAALGVKSLADYGDWLHEETLAAARGAVDSYVMSNSHREPTFTPAGEPPPMGAEDDPPELQGVPANRKSTGKPKPPSAADEYERFLAEVARPNGLTTKDLSAAFGIVGDPFNFRNRLWTIKSNWDAAKSMAEKHIERMVNGEPLMNEAQKTAIGAKSPVLAGAQP